MPTSALAETTQVRQNCPTLAAMNSHFRHSSECETLCAIQQAHTLDRWGYRDT